MHLRSLAVVSLLVVACSRTATVGSPTPSSVRPGISVLMTDSIGLVRGKRLALLTNQTGIDEHGVSDIERLTDAGAKAASVSLVRLFSPEHGIRGTEDREHLANAVDERSGLPIYSLYDAGTSAPPDSLLRDLGSVIVDLQDIGTRTWTYVGAMLYTMQSAARLHLRVIVLDRPNPITGTHTDGPYLDTALANAWPSVPGRPGKAYALYPTPLRHGMTMGELARFFNHELKLGTDLVVVPAAGWRRAMWFDETGLPWVKPSPNLPTLTSALLYPAIVPFEGSNVSVGRGTPDAFQRFGAPWLNAGEVVDILQSMRLPGLRFERDDFTPHAAGDDKYNERRIPGVHIVVTDRNVVDAGTLSAGILAAIHRTNRDSLRITARTFDERFGSTAAREAILAGQDPLQVMAPHRLAARRFAEQIREFQLYR
ncbi:MAG TPA: DUF1343 domain-containing protein [Gemmatimonadaceae bacterium]